jgi:hypothetical protein
MIKTVISTKVTGKKISGMALVSWQYTIDKISVALLLMEI